MITKCVCGEKNLDLVIACNNNPVVELSLDNR